MQNLPGITNITIPEEMKAHIQNFALRTDHGLPQKTVDVLIRYAENKEIMRIMGFTFFEQWDDGGRILTIEQFTKTVIKDIVAAYN